MPRDVMRIEIVSTEFGVANGDILIGDARAGTIQFHVGESARRVIRRLKKLGVPVRMPTRDEKKFKKS